MYTQTNGRLEAAAACNAGLSASRRSWRNQTIAGFIYFPNGRILRTRQVCPARSGIVDLLRVRPPHKSSTRAAKSVPRKQLDVAASSDANDPLFNQTVQKALAILEVFGGEKAALNL